MIETKKVACVTGTSLLTAMYGRNVTGINRPAMSDITNILKWQSLSLEYQCLCLRKCILKPTALFTNKAKGAFIVTFCYIVFL